MLTAFGRAFKTPDLRRKLLFTLAIIGIYRLGSVVPGPGVSYVAIQGCLNDVRDNEPVRPGEPVQRRRAAAADHLRARDHALHHELDHHRSCWWW